jgi:hexulose-6-phosphate isomerase
MANMLISAAFNPVARHDTSPLRVRCGVMQGRLSPPEQARFQSFPRHSWQEEFARARAAGLDYIEWIDDEYGRSVNPIFTPKGRAELTALKAQHAIEIPAICADFFLEFPFLRCPAAVREEREKHLHALIPIAQQIGAQRIVLPFVDNSRISTDSEKDTVIEILGRALPIADRQGVELHIEADFKPPDFAAFLKRIAHPSLKVNWDSGNSSGLGYLVHEEFAAYSDRIGSVHLKDRYRGPDGSIETRLLGEGSADFNAVFMSLRKLNYSGGFTLQVARGEDGDEINFLRDQLAFVKARWLSTEALT